MGSIKEIKIIEKIMKLKTGFLRRSIYWLTSSQANQEKKERKYKLPISGMREEILLQTLKIKRVYYEQLCQYTWKHLEFTNFLKLT